jgi:ribosome-binding factor A
MEGRRSERLAGALREELDEILNYELDDPAMRTVAVSELVLSPDGRKAHVRLTADGTPEEQANCLQAIEKAKGYIRHLLAERLDVYHIPDLRYDLDLDPRLREKASQLLRRMRRGRSRAPDAQKIPLE